jgi:putative transposase
MEYGNETNKSSVNRKARGKSIAELQTNIRRINDRFYKVKSQSGNGKYDVTSNALGWTCSCADHKFRGVKCKHIFAVEFSLALREQVIQETSVVVPSLDTLSCIQCNSDRIVKDAIRHNKHGDLQRYLCKECGKRFSINLGFEGMRATPHVITSAMQLYFTGESFRNVQKFLQLQGVKVTHVAVYKWIKKYVALMARYLDQITPHVSGVWRTDELYLKVKGNMKYLYAIMDDETRFWIAQQVADTKYTADIRPLFARAKEITGKRPVTLISDGAPNFHDAFKKEFATHKLPTTKHIRHIHIQGDYNNSKMERMNGEVRDREKVMRGLKIVDTKILPGYQIYHNYLRPHEALNGKTPAECCGIQIQGKNKWRTVIENASLQSREDLF